MSNTNSETNSEHTTSNDDTVPYTITEQDGKLNVVFTSGPKQGENFQIEKPHHFDTEHPQPQQVEEEPPYPYSYLDGQGIEISKEEFERLSAIDLAEEARLQSESRAAQAERRSR